MELGQRLRQARLEAGLSQRQLCGDVITRNMLSQIENGSARPSMETLRYLAGVLGKPMGYFLEEQAVTSPNQAVMEKAGCSWPEHPAQVLEILEAYRSPDPVFDREQTLLGALAAMEAGARALGEGRGDYARSLLKKAREYADRCPYWTEGLERQYLLLLYKADPRQGATILTKLPDPMPEIYLRAENQPERAGALLDAFTAEDPRWYALRGEAWFAQGAYAKARVCFEKAAPTEQNLSRLEQCCRELEDYKMAYYYACQLRGST